MSETGDYLRGIFNGEIPVKRKNPQTGETENVYYQYDDDREELKEAAVYPKRATGRFYEPMAFASAQPEEIDYTRYGDDIPRELINRMNADDRFWQVMNKYTIPSEGGYNNDPYDHGGETNFGISSSTYPREDIKNMTRERANALLYRDYWNYNGIKTLPDDVVGIVFESAVTRGGPETIKDVHRTLGIDPPGTIIGNTTHERLRGMDHERFRNDFADRMRAHYLNRVEEEPTQERYLDGWLNRVNNSVR